MNVYIIGSLVTIFSGLPTVFLIFTSILEYREQANVELLLTTQKIYWQSRGSIKLLPYANIQEVTRIHVNPTLDEYRKVRFVLKKPEPEFPDILDHVPRASPLFAILAQQGVSLVDG
jgi:hypothetical protein